MCLRVKDPDLRRALLQIDGGLRFELLGGIASGRDLDRQHGRAFVPATLCGLIRPTYADIRNQPAAFAEPIRLLVPDAGLVENGGKKVH